MASQLEDQHQIALIDWSHRQKLPTSPTVKKGAFVSDYLFHIPNGGKRGKLEAVRFKRMGVKAGVSDLFLPVPLHSFSGLWVELKAPFIDSKDKNYPSKDQREWLDKMSVAGFAVAVCYGWLEAKDIICNYLVGKA
ncbi:VRR-NUC domain-containing protein [Salinimonas marina]|uniref:VRR-NUC domain-containing protein n=1 Tax=Salinimonas marina TaxID=2785918 RepID=A0A7S9DYY6_9ALTE|nr:VRR-NUC domain-containing protein [Salinimonas marina]QPG06538.1 VRR-NUC domain-containing protein [Salinimonas marina]